MLHNPLLPSHPPTVSNSPTTFQQLKRQQYIPAVSSNQREEGQSWRPLGLDRVLRWDDSRPSSLTNSVDSAPISMSSANVGFHSSNHHYTGPAFDLSNERSSSAASLGGFSVPSHISHPPSQVHSRANSPLPYSMNGYEANNNGASKALPPSMISPYLQLPSSITKSQGSLAEFAAQITCLFWFESSTTVSDIEHWTPQSPTMPVTKLVPNDYPDTAFSKWVITILSTTQITQNVILLGLLFIYRLKKQNPNVKGNKGSEFRLLTVALMLGNKFLDDNTYTNKTWAEVSGIAVQEIHVMEVEFLSHMKYGLYTSAEQWELWHQQLSKFYTFFERASRRIAEPRPLPLNLRPSLQIPYALPSPPASNATSPPFRSSPTSASAAYPAPVSCPPMTVSPAVQLPDLEGGITARKRSYDHTMDEPMAKRLHHYSPRRAHALSRASIPNLSHPSMHTLPPIPALPTPSTAISQAYTPNSTMYNPISQGRNTSSTVLPPVNWLQAVGPTGPSGHGSQPSGGYGNSAAIDRPQWQPQYTSNRSSPTSANVLPSMAYTPNQYSPSYYLGRDSPYRPIRNIHTLLVPPPSGSLKRDPTRISEGQISWQPLAKQQTIPRFGPVPYFNHDTYASSVSVDSWHPNHTASHPYQSSN